MAIGASPDPFISNMAQQYSQQHGLYTPTHENYGNVAITRGASREIGRAYDSLPEFDRSAVPAYKRMAEETGRQFDFLTKPRSKGGMGIDVEVTNDDPYQENGIPGIINNVRSDIRNNNRIKVLSTRTTGGHPVFTDDQNDMFRAVHDVFGHLGSGRGVDMHGEEAAYQKHSRMFSPLARQAMATETRGQNAALHLHGGFQEQKVALLPQHLQSLQFASRGDATARQFAMADAIKENRKQGLGGI